MAQGRFLLDLGEGEQAEASFRKACREDHGEGCLALADLIEERGGAEAEDEADALHDRGLLLDMPLAELLVWGRPGYPEHGIVGMAIGFQPFALLRRMHFGVQAAVDVETIWELNGFVGYQHYFGYVAPYVMALGGVRLEKDEPVLANVGGELGVKLYPGITGFHFNFAVGTSLASPFHGSLGIGFDLGSRDFWKVVLFPLALCR